MAGLGTPLTLLLLLLLLLGDRMRGGCLPLQIDSHVDTDSTQQPPQPKTYVAIRGCKHSGTSWLRALVQENFVLEHGEGSSVPIAAYGWKHGAFLTQDRERLLGHPTHAVIVIFRGVFEWLPKMMMQPYNREYRTAIASHKGPRNLACLLRQPWRQRCLRSEFDSRTLQSLGCHEGDVRRTARPCLLSLLRPLLDIDIGRSPTSPDAILPRSSIPWHFACGCDPSLSLSMCGTQGGHLCCYTPVALTGCCRLLGTGSSLFSSWLKLITSPVCV